MFEMENYFLKYGEINLNEICRLCRNSKGVMSYIFSSIGIDTTEPLSNRIMSFINIEMREDDGLPNLICHRCLYHVEKLNEFKLKCEQSDALLRQYVSYQMDEESFKNMLTHNVNIPTPNEGEFNGLMIGECDIKPILNPIITKTQAADIENIVMVVDPSNAIDLSDGHESEASDNELNCPHCNKRLQTQEGFDRHIQIHSQDGPFPCDYCSVVEKDKASLKLHWRKEHSGNKAHMCQACGEAFSRREDLIKHNIRHDKIKPYPCNEPSCNKAFAYRSDLRKHLVIHTGARPYVCTICCKSFTRSTNLNKHYRLHSGRRPFSCTECDKLFASRGDLSRHAVIHTGEKPYSCPICMLSFNRKDKLLRHEKLHKGERPHTCYECPTSFHRKEELTKHIQFHHYSPVTTSFELRSAASKVLELVMPNEDESKTASANLPNANLNAVDQNEASEIAKTIIEEVNKVDRQPDATPMDMQPEVKPSDVPPEAVKTSDEQPKEVSEDITISVDPSHWDGAAHQCDICQRVFRHLHELKKHRYKHGKSKDFICEVCSKGFRTRRELTRHSHTHSNIKPFSCDTCGKSFSRRDKLNRHMKIHNSGAGTTLNKPVVAKSADAPVCEICLKTYSSQHELTRHLYTHSATKPFQCEFCPSSYCRKDKLVKHIKKAHPESSSESVTPQIEQNEPVLI